MSIRPLSRTARGSTAAFVILPLALPVVFGNASFSTSIMQRFFSFCNLYFVGQFWLENDTS
jgi:hypothetical protein